jgi:predicted nucleic acid-binding protein
MDLLIATTARVDDVPLLTANVRHFAMVPDLEVMTYR